MSAETDKISAQLPSVDEKLIVCSAISRGVDEQLFGTVSQTLVWFLLEYPEAWGAKAFEESQLPPAVKNHLSSLLKSTPGSRLLLIKRRPGANGSGVTFFVGLGRETAPVLYEYHLENYDELLSLDLPAVLADTGESQRFRRDEPLFLVCTNGRRDPCCARWGQPAFDKMSALVENLVWQSSHMGGHRFAANVLCFPHGIAYGRIDPVEVENLLAAYRRGQILLANYRGRACYPPEAQAAEFFLRSQAGSSPVEAYRLVSTNAIGSGAWEVRFTANPGSKLYRLEVAAELSDYQVYESCRSGEPARQTQYRFVRVEEIQP